jgi:hypothetical protein
MSEGRLELAPFELDETTYRDLLTREARQTFSWAPLATALAIAAILVGGALHARFRGFAEALRIWLPFLILAPLWGAFFLYLVPRTVARDPANRFLLGRYTVVVDGNQLRVATDTGRMQSIPLDQIAKFNEQPSWYALYETSQSALFLPKSAFPSPAAEIEFVRRVREARSSAA